MALRRGHWDKSAHLHIYVTFQGHPLQETGQLVKPYDSQKWVGRIDCLLLPEDNRNTHPAAAGVCQPKKKRGWGMSCSPCYCKDCISIINADQTFGHLCLGACECVDWSVISTLPFCKVSHWALLSSWYTVLQFQDFQDVRFNPDDFQRFLPMKIVL